MGIDENVDLLTEITWTPRTRKGVTGRLDENGAVNANPTIGLDAGYIWVRFSGERTAASVMNINVRTDRANIPVIVEELAPDLWQVKQVDPEDGIFTYGGDVAADLNRPNRIAELDKSPVAHKRIKDLRLRLDSGGGLVLYLDKGIYEKTDTTLENWDGGTIDTTASVPASEDTKRIVLIGLNSSNAIVQSAATAVVSSTAPTTSPYFTYDAIVTAANAATSTTRWLWAIPMFYGQTSFQNTDDFIDLRPIVYGRGGVYQVTATSPIVSSGGSAPNISLGTVPIANGGTGQTTATAAFNALSPLTTKADVLTNDGSNDIRLAVGSTNGMVLRVNSATTSGLEWSALGTVFEATLATTDATVTPLISYTVAELVGVTLQGRIIAVKTDRTAAYGASFRVSFRRATAGNVTLVGVGYVESDEDSAGLPAVTFSVNTGTQVGIVNFAGIAAENWSIKAHYTVTSV